MPARSVSSAISAMRPFIVTCWYQLSLPITVMQTRGSAHMFSSRLRVASMFTSTRPSSHRYQVAAVCGEPSGSCDAITEGLGSERNGSSDEGTGGLGMPEFYSAGEHAKYRAWQRTARPTIHSRLTGPKWRLSSDSPRLSPTMKYMPAGTVILRGKSHPSALAQGRMYGSASRFPLRYTWLVLTATTSPGPATTRLTNTSPAGPAVGCEHAASSGGRAPHSSSPVTAPVGGWKTTMSPIAGP